MERHLSQYTKYLSTPQENCQLHNSCGSTVILREIQLAWLTSIKAQPSHFQQQPHKL